MCIKRSQCGKDQKLDWHSRESNLALRYSNGGCRAEEPRQSRLCRSAIAVLFCIRFDCYLSVLLTGHSEARSRIPDHHLTPALPLKPDALFSHNKVQHSLAGRMGPCIDRSPTQVLIRAPTDFRCHPQHHVVDPAIARRWLSGALVADAMQATLSPRRPRRRSFPLNCIRRANRPPPLQPTTAPDLLELQKLAVRSSVM